MKEQRFNILSFKVSEEIDIFGHVRMIVHIEYNKKAHLFTFSSSTVKDKHKTVKTLRQYEDGEDKDVRMAAFFYCVNYIEKNKPELLI